MSIFDRKNDETILGYILRIYVTYIRGKSHTRYSKYLLIIGCTLLLQKPIEIIIEAIAQNTELINFQSDTESLIRNLATLCFITSPIIFIIFESVEIYKNKGLKKLPLWDAATQPMKSLSALKYTSAITVFTGRETELLSLDKFMSSNNFIMWWAISGMGGNGKSRLAYELVIKYGALGWQCGFYNQYLARDIISQWDPNCPHLIVVDYAGADIESLLHLLMHTVQLEQKSNLKYPIRLLILDRDAKTTVESIGNTPAFGTKLTSYLYDEPLIMLDQLSDVSLVSLVEDWCKFFDVDKKNKKIIVEKVINSQSNKKTMLAGLLCLNDYSSIHDTDENDFKGLIKKLINEEREKYWEKLGLDSAKEQYVLVATMADGINIVKTDAYGEVAKNFLAKFDFKEIYSEIVGERITDTLVPLSHDIVSELFALEAFDVDNQSDMKKFHEMIQICLGINHGKGLVNFFTRAANDWPHHPTLAMLIPRFNQTYQGVVIWLTIMSNVIDKISLPAEEKIKIFNRLVFGILKESEDTFHQLMSLFNGLFLRILFDLTKSEELKLWVRDYSIIEVQTDMQVEAGVELVDGFEEEAVPSPKQKDLIAKIQLENGLTLLPEKYCNTVIKNYLSLSKQFRDLLAWQGLFEIFYHNFIHRLSNRESDLDVVHAELKALDNSFDKRWAKCMIYRDVMAGFSQFGHTHTKKEKIKEISKYLLENSKEQLNETFLPEFLSSVSSVYGFCQATFDEKMELYEIWNNRYKDKMLNDENLATNFVGFCVSLMNGFYDNESLNTVVDIVNIAEKLAMKYTNKENVRHINYCYTQLARRSRGIMSYEEGLVYLEKAISNSTNHYKIELELPTLTLREVNSFYSSALNKSEVDIEEGFDKVINFCKEFVNVDLEKHKFYPGTVIVEYFNQKLELCDVENLKKVCSAINELNVNKNVDLSHIWQSINQFLSKYQTLANSGNLLDAGKISQAASYWLENLDDNKNIKGVLEHIVADYEWRASSK